MKNVLLMVLFLCLIMGCRPSNIHFLLLKRIDNYYGSPRNTIDGLVRELGIPAGIEEYSLYGACANSTAVFAHQTDFRGHVAILVLRRIIGPSYRWYFAHGVLNVSPRNIERSDPLEQKLVQFDVRDSSSEDAIKAVYARVGVTFGEVYPVEFGTLSPPTFGAVTLSLRNLTARDVLNRIVAADGQIIWNVLKTEEGWRGDVRSTNWIGGGGRRTRSEWAKLSGQRAGVASRR
jgi:hypothetical protein